MTDPRHVRILANIAAQVAQQYTLTRSGSTTDPEAGNVPVPVVDESWNYTLPEEYQA